MNVLEIVEETRQKLAVFEGDRIDPKTRREFLNRIEAALKEERKAEEDVEDRAESSKTKINIDSIESELNDVLDASEKEEELAEAEYAKKQEEKKKLKGMSRQNNEELRDTKEESTTPKFEDKFIPSPPGPGLVRDSTDSSSRQMENKL